MKKIIPIIFLLAFSCTKQVLNDSPRGYSFLPAYLNIDSIKPIFVDDTNRVVDATMHDFVSIPVDSGLLTTKSDKKLIPAGILISERKASLYVFYKSSWEQEQSQLFYTKYLMKEYYDKSKSAEILYQNEIKRWQKEAQRSWVEKNLIYFGFLAGIITTVLTEYAVVNVK